MSELRKLDNNKSHTCKKIIRHFYNELQNLEKLCIVKKNRLNIIDALNLLQSNIEKYCLISDKPILAEISGTNS